MTTIDTEPVDVVADRNGLLVLADDRLDALDGSGRVVWHVPVDHLADRTPAVAGGVVAVAREDGVVAFDRATGATRWSVAVEGVARMQEVDAGPSAAIFVMSEHGGLRVLDAATGRVRWDRVFTGGAVGGVAGDGVHLAATVWDEGGGAGHVLGLDPATGGTRWVEETQRFPSVPAAADGVVVVGQSREEATDESIVVGYDAASGRPTWTALAHGGFHSAMRPAVWNGSVLLADAQGHVLRLDARTGQFAWETVDLGGGAAASRLLVAGDAVFVNDASGYVLVLGRDTGNLRSRRTFSGPAVGMAVIGRELVVVRRVVPRSQVIALPLERIAAPAPGRLG
jgi:outer membrane protein assembly factor BamB